MRSFRLTRKLHNRIGMMSYRSPVHVQGTQRKASVLSMRVRHLTSLATLTCANTRAR